jgi:hypothetical protein
MIFEQFHLGLFQQFHISGSSFWICSASSSCSTCWSRCRADCAAFRQRFEQKIALAARPSRLAPHRAHARSRPFPFPFPFDDAGRGGGTCPRAAYSSARVNVVDDS